MVEYRMRDRSEKFFTFGRVGLLDMKEDINLQEQVFQTIWDEPKGGTAKDHSANVSINPYGKLVFSKNRIFVVIKDNENDSSQCL